MNSYQTFDTLQRHKAILHNMLWLDNHLQQASWYNCDDRVTNIRDHHTLSLYTAQGEDTWYRSPQGW